MEDDVKESRREVLSKAWDEVEEKQEPVHAEKPENIELPHKAPDEGVRSSDAEAPEKNSDKVEKEAKKLESDNSQKKEEQAARESLSAKPVPVTDRAPNSWKPAIREHWTKLPPEVRAEVSRRELEVQQTLSQTAQVRKFAQDFAQTINPYSHLIRAQNSTPLKAVENLMQTAAGLVQGSQQQKAAIVADIINNYGIDIQTLDSVLTQKYNPQSAQQPQVQAPPAWAKPIFGFMDNVQKMQEQRQLQLQQEADQAISILEQKPFFDDVREDMADLMEAAANRGRALSMEQAYEKAIALNPELTKIVNQRKLAETNRNPVSEAAATLARARKASSAVKGAPTGPRSGANGKLSRRQQLSEAWDDAST